MQNFNLLNVTQAQLDACERIIDLNRNEVFYLVASQSKPGTHYKVVYDRERKSLRCLPFDGEACPASVEGLTCWHMKAAVAHAALYREEQARQAHIERLMDMGLTLEEAKQAASAQLIVDGKLADDETLVRVFGPRDRRPSEKEMDAQAAAYQSCAFSILR